MYGLVKAFAQCLADKRAAGKIRHTFADLGADGASAPICCRGRPVMTSGELAIVIAGTREDWPGGGEDPDPAREFHPGTELVRG